jgi:prepilin-type N-terminal cleavage/methylation domain-containing protein
MKRNRFHSQSGFTLVEIAIVLVIIGLLLGGVLKGQELIEQSKIKRVVNDFNNVAAAIITYQDRYRFLPGDDPNAATRWTAAVGGSAATSGNGDGVLATVAFGLSTTESGLAWQHLRAAGLVTGDMSSVARSETAEQTPFGSSYGIGGGTLTATTSVMGFGAAPLFCASLPPKAAEQLDRQLDDGNPQTGNIRANAPSTAMNTAPAAALAGTTVYVDATNTWYTVCRKL